jgi:hypothetical protein
LRFSALRSGAHQCAALELMREKGDIQNIRFLAYPTAQPSGEYSG